MRISRDITRTTSLCILMTTVLLSGVAPVMGAGDRDWLDTMVQAVLAEQVKNGSEEGSLSQYVEQLAAVRAHLLNGESEAVYRTMNRFMEMLQAREAGISAEAADRLFDYCYLVTPPRYHDVSRHLHRLS